MSTESYYVSPIATPKPIKKAYWWLRSWLIWIVRMAAIRLTWEFKYQQAGLSPAGWPIGFKHQNGVVLYGKQYRMLWLIGRIK